MGLDVENNFPLIISGSLFLGLLFIWLWFRSHLNGMELRHSRLLEKQQAHYEQLISELRDSEIQALFGLQKAFMEQGNKLSTSLEQRLSAVQLSQQQVLAEHYEHLEQRQAEHGRVLHETLQKGLEATGRQVLDSLGRNTEELGKRMHALTETTEKRLGEISGQVEQRLSDGFEKTTETFSQVLQHLSRIDEAQKKITELSSSVVNLQEVLADKRSRGAFGEVQLAGLMRNLMPERGFQLQYTMNNGLRVDCMLFLPEPTGNVPIDAKFPLESYRRLSDPELPDADRGQAVGQFQKDIRKHIDDIAGKYIVPGETSDGAVMFIPAEAVFAEIHAHYPGLIEEAYRKRVWLVSPTTLMAVLTTARAVLKDAETRKQVHIIRDHLQALSQDFGRFRKRMDNLSKHIKQANRDVTEIHTSADKISNRFEKIERVELEELGEPVDDFNFDGYKDLAIQQAIGYMGVNVFYDVYLYQPKQQRFKLGFHDSNIEADAGAKVITASQRSGPRWYSNIYKINQGKPYVWQARTAMVGDSLDRVEYKNPKGQIVKTIIEDTRIDNHPETAAVRTINAEMAFFYKTPSEQSKTRIYVIKGDKVKLLDYTHDMESGEWFYVSYQGKKKVYKGWIKWNTIH